MAQYSGSFKEVEMNITSDDIKEAFEKTEEKYDEFDGKTRYVEINGVKKPQKEVFLNIEQISEEGFQRDDFSTNNTDRIFRNAGVETINEYDNSARYIKETLTEFSDSYSGWQNDPEDSHPRAKKLVQERAENLFGYLVRKSTDFSKKDFEIESSIGSGTWAEFSWLAIRDTNGRRLEGGSNPVLLINPDENKIYLVFQQRVSRKNEDGKRTNQKLKETTKRIQSKYNLPGFEEGPIGLDGSELVSKYGIAAAFYKKYDLSNLDIAEFEEDVSQISEFFLNNVGEEKKEDNMEDIELSDQHEKFKDLLDQKKQIIFYGPPGTGKTHAAREFAEDHYESEEYPEADFSINQELFDKLTEIKEINDNFGLEGTGSGYNNEDKEEIAKENINDIKRRWTQLKEYIESNVDDLDNYNLPSLPHIDRRDNQAKYYYWTTWSDVEKASKSHQLQVLINRSNIRVALWYESNEEANEKLESFLDRVSHSDLDFLDQVRVRTKEGDILYSEEEDLNLDKIRDKMSEQEVVVDFSNVISREKVSQDSVPQKITRNLENEILPLFKFATGDSKKINLKNGKKYDVVTFHPSFSYEEFVEGIKAETTDDGINYNNKKGEFRKICKDAREDSENDHLLIIDEINRGNISSIFGELITLLEKDKRGEMYTKLPYSEKPFTIPENLHIIGTMNTADRSITNMDVALRRRFAHLEFEPDIGVYWKETEDYKSREDLEKIAEEEHNLHALSVLSIESINKKLMEKGLDPGKKIGHSYFIDSKDPDKVLQTWKYEIFPLLQEYFHEDYQEISDLLNDKEDGKIVNMEMRSIKDFNEEQLVSVLRNLVEL